MRIQPFAGHVLDSVALGVALPVWPRILRRRKSEYLFHKSGHHKLERAVSILNIGASAEAISFDVVHHYSQNSDAGLLNAAKDARNVN